MRRCLIVILAFLFVFGCAGTTFAANVFDDVPANHWAYGAVTKLVHDGVLRGYSNPNFSGNTIITRYEMAIMVANAMARADKASVEDQMILQKLKNEFGEELNGLGVHVFSLEKKADKIRMSVLGFSKVDWHDIKNTVSADKFQETGNRFESGVKIVVDTYYKVNDDWTAMVESEYNRDWRTGLYASTKWNQCKELKAFGKIGTTKAMVGRFIDHPGEGVVFGDYITGMQFGFGDGGLNGPGGPAPLMLMLLARKLMLGCLTQKYLPVTVV
ncbi:MAG: S-layer protein [Firmicutes bacterium]|nr:S-layer protein [Bacillota bacterium]